MWTLQTIKSGLEKFYKENNHYPTAYEIDNCSYLPSARSIQRSFGGLEKVREKLGLKITHYGKGAIRSKKAYDVGIRGKNIENEVEPVLVGKFGEIFVHTQKRINNISADFFVYNPDENFGVDVFCFENTKDFSNIINHKQKIYSDYAFKIILLAIGEKEEFPQTQIDKLINNKKILPSDRFMVMNLSSLKEWIEKLRVYDTPIKLNKFHKKSIGNPEDFKKWAKLYLDGAETLHEIKNRNPYYWIVCFYLLSHSLELALKAYLTSENVKGHKLKLLAKKFNEKSDSKITNEEMPKISELAKLNKGQGGLRYDNKINDNFFPSTFQTLSSLIKRLL